MKEKRKKHETFLPSSYVYLTTFFPTLFSLLHLPPFRPLWPSALPVATRPLPCLLPFYKYILPSLSLFSSFLAFFLYSYFSAVLELSTLCCLEFSVANAAALD